MGDLNHSFQYVHYSPNEERTQEQHDHDMTTTPRHQSKRPERAFSQEIKHKTGINNK